MEYNKEKYQQATSMLLNLTDDCNCACTYCFVEQHPHYMTYEIAIDAVEYFVKHLKKIGKKGSITYFGGEPTLMWDKIIVPLTIYIKDNYSDLISLTMTTNGTLLNEERIKFMKDYNIYPHLSIDGIKEVQDINRPLRNGKSNFDTLYPNIKILLDAFPYTTFRATVSQYTCDKLFESYLFAIENGFSNAFFGINERESWSKENIEKLKKEIFKITAHRLFYFSNNMIPPINLSQWDDGFKMLKSYNIQAILKSTNRIIGKKGVFRCGLGTTSFSVGYDGSIYGCQEQPSKDEKNIFRIGNIYDGIDEEKHKNLLELYNKEEMHICENPSRCDNCSLRNTCFENSCPSTSFDMYNKFGVSNEINCNFREWIFLGTVGTVKTLSEENKEFLKEYIKNVVYGGE